MTGVDVRGILESAGADPQAPEGSQAWALAQVDAAVAELIEVAARQATVAERLIHLGDYGNRGFQTTMLSLVIDTGKLRAALARVQGPAEP